jgi:rod shape-determining protein MreC
MSVAGHSPPPFFKRGPAPLARLIFFMTLSIAALIIDVRFKTLEWVRVAIATAVWPLQKAAYLPIEAAGGLTGYVRLYSTVAAENERLRAQALESAGLLLRQEHLELENKRMRALLDMRERHPAAGRMAEILYAARDPFSRRVIIDKGIQHGIALGQAVVDELGVVGQITRVFPLTAEVSLLTDKEQAIPVQVSRSGLRAVLAGAGAGTMELRFLAANAEVKEGDVLVTSGLDGLYLPGLPVAKVSKIDRDNSFSFARITCEPIAGVERHGMVLVLETRQTLPPQPDDEAAAKSKKASKGERVRKKLR